MRAGDIPSIDLSKRRKRGVPWIIGIGALVVLVIAAIVIVRVNNSGSHTVAADGSGRAGEPRTGGELTIGVVQTQETPDFQFSQDWGSRHIGNLLGDRLLYQDVDSGGYTGWLASSWEVSDDLTAFTFTLRPDVTFSDGSPLTAEVVKANLDQLVFGDSTLNIAPRAANVLLGYKETVVNDHYSFTVRLTEPSVSFLANVSSGGRVPGFLSPKTLTKSFEERTDPAVISGTGPFVYDADGFEATKKTVLVKRDDYDWAPSGSAHQGPAYLDRITFELIPEGSVRKGALENGRVDAIWDVLPTDENDVKNKGYQLFTADIAGRNESLNFNTRLAPTNEWAVRRALIIGWDRKTLGESILQNASSQIAGSIITSSVPGYVDFSDTALAYDPDEAKRLLDEAGWKVGDDGIRQRDGERLRVVFRGVDLKDIKNVFEYIQQGLKKIGVDVVLSVPSVADATPLFKSAITEANALSTSGGVNDVAVITQGFSPVSNSNGGVSFIDKDFAQRQEIIDSLAKLETTLDPAARKAQAEKVQEDLFVKYALANPLYTARTVVAAAQDVHDIRFESAGFFNLYSTWVE